MHFHLSQIKFLASSFLFLENFFCKLKADLMNWLAPSLLRRRSLQATPGCV